MPERVWLVRREKSYVRSHKCTVLISAGMVSHDEITLFEINRTENVYCLLKQYVYVCVQLTKATSHIKKLMWKPGQNKLLATHIPWRLACITDECHFFFNSNAFHCCEMADYLFLPKYNIARVTQPAQSNQTYGVALASLQPSKLCRLYRCMYRGMMCLKCCLAYFLHQSSRNTYIFSLGS